MRTNTTNPSAIVSRLREALQPFNVQNGHVTVSGDLLQDALNALTAEHIIDDDRGLGEMLVMAVDDKIRLRVEAERLRAALREIASQMHNLPRSATADAVERLCRAALNGDA